MKPRVQGTACLLIACLSLSVLQADESPGKSKSETKTQQKQGKGNATSKQAARKKQAEPAPPATMNEVSYGPHPKQVMSFWKAESDKPTPLVFFIHGGGWQGGNRMAGMAAWVPAMHKKGISVVSIEYRFIEEAITDQVEPPVKACLHDAARALQFVRSHAKEWNIDPERIGASGGSAGACSSLWLAFHNDLADPASPDPIARQSSRLKCAAVTGAQTTLDPVQMKEWIPNSVYGSHAFGIFRDVNGKKERDFEAFLARRNEIMPWIQEYSPWHLVTPDDPPVALFFSAVPAKGEVQKDPTHSANFGVLLQEKLNSVSVPCELVYPGSPDAKHKTGLEYLAEKL